MKKKIVWTLVAVLVCGGLLGVFSLFKKPSIIISKIEVIPAEVFYSGNKSIPYEYVLESIQRKISNKNEDQIAQVFWEDDEIPSNDISDYSLLKIYIDIENNSIWKTTVQNLFVDAYDTASDLLIETTFGFSETFLPHENGEMKMLFTAFTSDKSEEEITNALQSIRLQIPFSNRIYSMSNVYADCKDAEIVFVGDDG